MLTEQLRGFLLGNGKRDATRRTPKLRAEHFLAPL